MKYTPILFGADMVRAILEGRKTQTRRTVKKDIAGRVSLGGRSWHIADPNCTKACPLGQPGDLLWVREPARVDYVRDEGEDGMELAIRYMADDVVRLIAVPERLDMEWQRKYKVGWPVPKWVSECQGVPNGVFREASRITLEITDVRVERVQEITDDDAVADLGCWRVCDEDEPCDTTVTLPDPVGNYRTLWDALYEDRGLAWSTNPWVWVIEFRRVEA